MLDHTQLHLFFICGFFFFWVGVPDILSGALDVFDMSDTLTSLSMVMGTVWVLQMTWCSCNVFWSVWQSNVHCLTDSWPPHAWLHLLDQISTSVAWLNLAGAAYGCTHTMAVHRWKTRVFKHAIRCNKLDSIDPTLRNKVWTAMASQSLGDHVTNNPLLESEHGQPSTKHIKENNSTSPSKSMESTILATGPSH